MKKSEFYLLGLLMLLAPLFVSCSNNDKSAATQTVSVSSSSGPVAIDLGLPSGLKWASCNVGATTPEGYGAYYAWGEIEEKKDYSWETYKWCDGDAYGMTKYSTDHHYCTRVDNKTVLDLEDDVAHVKWGGNWRMPTSEELQELLDKCTWTWATLNGIKGYRITGSNGNSIFLPAAGYGNGTSVSGQGLYGLYWSALNGGSNDNSAWGLYFYSSDYLRYGYERYYGYTVRPVCK